MDSPDHAAGAQGLAAVPHSARRIRGLSDRRGAEPANTPGLCGQAEFVIGLRSSRDSSTLYALPSLVAQGATVRRVSTRRKLRQKQGFPCVMEELRTAV